MISVQAGESEFALCSPHVCASSWTAILTFHFHLFAQVYLQCFLHNRYQYVGQSFIILLFIQTIFPLINVIVEILIKWAMRAYVGLKKEATQVSAARCCVCCIWNLIDTARRGSRERQRDRPSVIKVVLIFAGRVQQRLRSSKLFAPAARG